MATFRKRGSSWTYQIEYKDEDGHRKQLSKGGFKTKKDAQTAAAEIELKISKHEFYQNKKMTVADFLDKWVNDYARHSLKESSFKNREIMIRARIIPAIGDFDLEKIKPYDVIKFYNYLLDSKLSSSYVHTIHRLLKNAFKFAVKWQFVNHSIMESVDAPKLTRKTVKTWTLSEVKSFINQTTFERYQIAFLLAIYTGMRRGEILDLKWTAVDLSKKVLSVINGKTKTSHRLIALPDILIEALKKHRAKQNEYKLKMSSGYRDFDLVIATEIGTEVGGRNLNRYFSNAVKKCSGVPVIRFHDLRHTHATLLLSIGENPKIVSERLGHSRVNTTLDIYSHVIPDMQTETAKRLNALLK